MWFDEDAAEEELQESSMVAQPVVGVVFHPIDVFVEFLIEHGPGCVPERSPRREGNRRSDEHDRSDTLRVLRGQKQGPSRAGRQRNQRGRRRCRVVHDRQGVSRELLVRVHLRVERSIGESVAPTVHHEHATVPRQMGDLEFPVAGVDDRPRRQQEHRRVALAVQLPVEPDAVPNRVPLTIRLPGSHCSASSRSFSARSESGGGGQSARLPKSNDAMDELRKRR